MSFTLEGGKIIIQKAGTGTGDRRKAVLESGDWLAPAQPASEATSVTPVPPAALHATLADLPEGPILHRVHQKRPAALSQPFSALALHRRRRGSLSRSASAAPDSPETGNSSCKLPITGI
ncbi:MAG: hypothetical protein WCY32_15275 [Burkholderiaceae bacterium]